MTVKELLELCKNQVAHGNGDKKIILSQDEEGNGGYEMLYGFGEVSDLIYPPIEENEMKDYVLLG